VITFVRLVDLDVEGSFYDRAVNRIRHYYLELAGEDGRCFTLSGHDDIRRVMANVGSPASYGQLWFTGATAIAVVNSVVGGPAWRWRSASSPISRAPRRSERAPPSRPSC
jgi:hypothetical protein